MAIIDLSPTADIVYIVLIDSKGIMAFQPFNLDRWAKCRALYNLASNPEKSHLLFKIRLSKEESDICKITINNKKYMAVAKYLVQLRKSRGDAE